jgi:hypothetical protein
VGGNQLYNNYAPQMQFLQLGEVQAHRSALAATNEQEVNLAGQNKQMHATTGILEVDDTVHMIDKELMTHHNHEVAV